MTSEAKSRRPLEQESPNHDLTFSQAHGYDEFPTPLKLEEISAEARSGLWNLLYSSVVIYDDVESKRSVDLNWARLLRRIYADYFRLPLDEFELPVRKPYETDIKSLVVFKDALLG
jgi:hypothetical protein